MKAAWRKIARYTALTLLLYAVFLATSLPAARAYPLIKGRLESIALYRVSGTIWQGHADLIAAKHVQLPNVSWKLNPWVLLLGRIEAKIDFHNDLGPGHAVVGRSLGGRVYFKDVDLHLPATILEPILKAPNAKWEGSMDVQLAGLSIERGFIAQAQGTLLWSKAAMATPWPLRLGAFQATLEDTQEGVKVALTDKGGAVQADALLLLKNDGKYQFTGHFSSRDPQQPNIAQGLMFLGNPGPDGRVKITASGSLPPLLGGAS